MADCFKQAVIVQKHSPTVNPFACNELFFGSNSHFLTFKYPDLCCFQTFYILRDYVASTAGGFGFIISLESSSGAGAFLSNRVLKNGGVFTHDNQQFSVEGTVFASAEAIYRRTRQELGSS